MREEVFFSLQKILNLVKVNLFRLDIIWEVVIASLVDSIESKNVKFS